MWSAVVGLAAILEAPCWHEPGEIEPERAALERSCREASNAERWQDAAIDCPHAAARLKDPSSIVFAARALQHVGRVRESLATAERGFGTSADATARQIAGSQREQLGDRAQALLLYNEALAMHRVMGEHLEAARDSYLLAGALLRQRSLAEAMDATSVSLREAQLADNPRSEGYAYRAQGDVLAAIGDAPAARNAFARAGSILGAWPQDVPWVLLKHGEFVLELGDTHAAVDILTNALDTAMRAGLERAVVAARLNLARAEHALGHLAAAQRHLDDLGPQMQADPIVGYVAGLIAADRGELAVAKQLLATAAKDPPDDDYAADITYQQGVLAEREGDLDAARKFYRSSIGFVEAIRARTTAREMRPWMLARRRAPYEALFVLAAAAHRDAEALETAELLHARTWLDGLVAPAADRTRPSGRSTTSAAPLSTAEILAAIGDREIVIYVAVRDVLWRIHVEGRKIVDVVRLPETIVPLLASWRDHPDDPAIADKLGPLLIPADLATSQRVLYLVAPDHLAQVPFAALRRSQRYLIVDRPLVRLPGAAAASCRPRDQWLSEPVVVADSHGNLPHARDEAEHAAAAVHGHAHVGADATIAQVTSARHARLFHASVHALVEGAGGALDMADGRLTAEDIITKNIDPQVAVLAGCATGVSNDNEGWDALPSAFLVAGTRTVVATLRPVNDSDAALVIKPFYDEHGDEHPATSLAKVQRQLAAKVPPHVWASFAVWGDAEPGACREESL